MKTIIAKLSSINILSCVVVGSVCDISGLHLIEIKWYKIWAICVCINILLATLFFIKQLLTEPYNK